MNGAQVKCVLSFICDKLGNRKCFYDVFDCRQLDKVKITRYPTLLVVNTVPAPSDGHWVAFFIPHKRATLEFFDAFDMEPQSYNAEFGRFIAKFGGAVDMPRGIQCYDSSACGPHCLRYLYNRLRGKTIRWIYKNEFSTSRRANDKRSYKFVHRIINLFSINYRKLYATL